MSLSLFKVKKRHVILATVSQQSSLPSLLNMHNLTWKYITLTHTVVSVREFVCWTCNMCKPMYPWGRDGSMISERRGTSIPMMGVQTYYFDHFSWKLHANEKKLDRPYHSLRSAAAPRHYYVQRRTKNWSTVANTRQFSICNCCFIDCEGDLWTNPWNKTYWYHHKIKHRKELTMCQKKHSRFVWFSYVPVPI